MEIDEDYLKLVERLEPQLKDIAEEAKKEKQREDSERAADLEEELRRAKEENERFRRSRRKGISARMKKAVLIVMAGAAAIYGGKFAIENRGNCIDSLRKWYRQEKISGYRQDLKGINSLTSSLDLENAREELSELEEGLNDENSDISSMFDTSKLRKRIDRNSYFMKRFRNMDSRLEDGACGRVEDLEEDYSAWKEELKSDNLVEWDMILASDRVLEFERKLDREPERCELKREKRLENYRGRYSSAIEEMDNMKVESAGTRINSLKNDLEGEDESITSKIDMRALEERFEKTEALGKRFNSLNQRLEDGACGRVKSLKRDYQEWEQEVRAYDSKLLSADKVLEFEKKLDDEPERCEIIAREKKAEQRKKKIKEFDRTYSSIENMANDDEWKKAMDNLSSFERRLDEEEKSIRNRYDTQKIHKRLTRILHYVDGFRKLKKDITEADCGELEEYADEYSRMKESLHSEKGLPVKKIEERTELWSIGAILDDSMAHCNFEPYVFKKEGNIYFAKEPGMTEEGILLVEGKDPDKYNELAMHMNIRDESGGHKMKNYAVIDDFKASPNKKHLICTAHYGSEQYFIIMDTDGTDRVDIIKHFEPERNYGFKREYSEIFWVDNDTFGFNLDARGWGGPSDGKYMVTFDRLNQPVSMKPYSGR
ncbi:MAG: hypothetical protein R6U32_07285 [Candidatus Woesearchaeota archaeon]